MEYICKVENVTFEKEALDVIAEKADGGLRDALSMFDFIIAFSGGNITYKGVIESLNILDYDYFFKFIDHMLQNDMPSCLMMFDEILAKGFQGDTFIDGLSKHIRNLLVGKDNRTIALMNVPQTIKQRYLQQSQNAPMKFLLNALNFANTSAMEYRASNNKRLCVELMLMKICSIMAKLNARPATTTQVQPPTPQQTLQQPQNVQQAPQQTAVHTTAEKKTL